MASRKFTVLIEDNPEARGLSGKIRQLEVYCVINSKKQIKIQCVKNLVTDQLLGENDDIPSIQAVSEALALYDWYLSYSKVFSGTQVFDSNTPPNDPPCDPKTKIK